jgi:hypothetical protein
MIFIRPPFGIDWNIILGRRYTQGLIVQTKYSYLRIKLVLGRCVGEFDFDAGVCPDLECRQRHRPGAVELPESESKRR